MNDGAHPTLHNDSADRGMLVPSVDGSLAAKLLVFVLSVIAGSVDIIGFLEMGGLFIAHITGNLVALAARLVAGDQPGIFDCGSDVHSRACADQTTVTRRRHGSSIHAHSTWRQRVAAHIGPLLLRPGGSADPVHRQYPAIRGSYAPGQKDRLSRAIHAASIIAGYPEDDLFPGFLSLKSSDLRVDLYYPALPKPRTDQMLMIECGYLQGRAPTGKKVCCRPG
jgi:hypothetical protein